MRSYRVPPNRKFHVCFLLASVRPSRELLTQIQRSAASQSQLHQEQEGILALFILPKGPSLPLLPVTGGQTELPGAVLSRFKTSWLS